ncbi:MAG TPA: hypothetical protein ENK32_10315 [Anaerolineae bacterium]|nr:hypothetical protein [Anaerolineae bacterium]
MRFDEFTQLTQLLGVFDSALVLPFYDSPQQAYRQLSDWTRAGKLLQLRRGLYTFPNEQPNSYVIANRLIRPSYVSLQSALSYYDLIPEQVASVTSVTTGRPITLNNKFGRFIFRHIKTDFFFGFRYWPVTHTQSAFMATPEKALLDLIYLTPDGANEAYIRELRLQNLEIINPERLSQLVERANRPKLRRALPHILAVIHEETEGYVTL